VTRILVVDDDPLVTGFVERGLRAGGYRTEVETDPASVLARADGTDLVLLDLVLGGDDGFALLRALRRRRNDLPVLVMTGHPERRDVVSCLENGADDYITKPFRFEVLLARVRARLRRTAPTVLSTGDLSLNLLTRQAVAGGSPVDLTTREFALLETLIRHPGEVLSRVFLLSRVWGDDHDRGSNVLPVYIAALRRKLGSDRIRTVRGAGYRLG
jgi:two-component system copper resistance phosphate regulon response regulator CusR